MPIIDGLLTAAILCTTIFMAGVRRIKLLIITLIFQSIAIALTFFNQGIITGESHYFVLGGLTFAVKVVFIPLIIGYATRHAKLNYEMEYFIDVYWSYIVAIIVFVLTFAFLEGSSNTILKLGIILMSIGGLLMVGRKRLITQMVGFLGLENGLLLFETSVTNIPILIDAGVIFEVGVLALTMGLLLFQVYRTYNTDTLETLSELKE